MVKAANNNDNYRYERKFFISELSKHEIELIVKLHPAMFIEIYSQRFINNIYFDSFKMQNYFDNVNGAKERIKVRIRWYGNLMGTIRKPVLEFKIKDGIVGKKESFLLPPFSLDKNIQIDTILDIFRKAEIPDIFKSYLASMEFSIINRYSRKYYMSADRNYRITIDSDMEFQRIFQYNNTFSHKSKDFVNKVLEIKYKRDKDPYVDRITNRFPFIMTKSSKYVTGVERLNLW